MALSPAQVPDWPKTQLVLSPAQVQAWVTETSPAKISARSEFIVDDAPAVRGSAPELTIVERDECAEALRRGARSAVGRAVRRSEGGDLGHTFVGRWAGRKLVVVHCVKSPDGQAPASGSRDTFLRTMQRLRSETLFSHAARDTI